MPQGLRRRRYLPVRHLQNEASHQAVRLLATPTNHFTCEHYWASIASAAVRCIWDAPGKAAHGSTGSGRTGVIPKGRPPHCHSERSEESRPHALTAALDSSLRFAPIGMTGAKPKRKAEAAPMPTVILSAAKNLEPAPATPPFFWDIWGHSGSSPIWAAPAGDTSATRSPYLRVQKCPINVREMSEFCPAAAPWMASASRRPSCLCGCRMAGAWKT